MRKGISQNHYEVLDLPIDATSQEIEMAYKLTKKAFSDNSLAVYSLFDVKETKEMLRKIEEAYEVLSSYEKKKKYDEMMLGETEKKISNDSRRAVVKDYVSSEEEEIVSSYADKKDKQYSLKGYTTSLFRNDKEVFEPDKDFEEKIAKETKFKGEFLKEIRQYRKLSINEIATITKINPDYLVAIEEFDLQKLPARVYLTGFLKQYARLLKLDEKKVSSGYLKLIEESKHG
jgi:curved DNA-binding protein CbpA